VVPGPRLYPEPMLRRLTLGAACLLTVVTVGGAVPAAASTESAPPGGLTWGPCEEGVDEPFECATLTVPLDYAEPEGATIDLALIRYPAEPAVREGAILLNPGGPGASGFGMAAAAPRLDVEMGLGGRFDIIGFDPRGVDRSGGIDCVDDAAIDELLYSDDTPDDDAEYVAAIAQQAAFGQACREVYGDTLRQYSTENTARDMDMIRAALGDDELSYLGVSYGTYLGGVYATLFPERVRAMALDSAFEPSGDSEFDQWSTQLVGFEQAFANWAAWCEESSDCAFNAMDVGARWDALIAALDANPVKSDSGRPVNQAAMTTATVSAMYSEIEWPALGKALADAEGGDGTLLLQMADDYNGRSADGTYESRRESGRVIRCASGIDPKMPADPAALLQELHRVAPRFARGYDESDFYDLCGDLVGGDIEPIAPSYSGSAPVVVVGGLNDPATPFRWAEELAAEMGSNVSLLTFSGEGHGQVLFSSCVTDAEASVIRDLRVPAAGAVCDPDPPLPRPLFWDQLPVPDGVGPLVDDPTIDLALGIVPDTEFYVDVWHLAGDVATVAAAYETALNATGFDVVDRSELPEGLTRVIAFAPDGTQVTILLYPPEALQSNPDLERAAELALPGQGFVAVVALGDN
jgi:pimeloyl-ACP methyl ester carboxylesterase